MKVLRLMLVSLFSVLIIYGFTGFGQQKKAWNVPPNFKTMKNPKKSDANSINVGKTEWNKSCKACHGAKGLGDGPKAKGLKTPAGDFSVDIKGETDGELYYKTKTGRDEMPKYDKKIADDDIWHLVNFMRSLQK